MYSTCWESLSWSRTCGACPAQECTHHQQQSRRSPRKQLCPKTTDPSSTSRFAHHQHQLEIDLHNQPNISRTMKLRVHLRWCTVRFTELRKKLVLMRSWGNYQRTKLSIHIPDRNPSCENRTGPFAQIAAQKANISCTNKIMRTAHLHSIKVNTREPSWWNRPQPLVLSS